MKENDCKQTGDSAVLAENIKRLRTKGGMTQKELADHLFITFQAVSKWETGKTAPDIFTLPELAKLLNCRIDDLFSIAIE